MDLLEGIDTFVFNSDRNESSRGACNELTKTKKNETDNEELTGLV